MWIWIANKSAKFHAKNLTEVKIFQKSFRGGGVATFLKHPVYRLNTVQKRYDYKVSRSVSDCNLYINISAGFHF